MAADDQRLFNERTVSEKGDVVETLQKALNSLVDCYLDAGLVAKDDAMSTLREVAHYVKKSVPSTGQSSTGFDGIEAFVLVNCELGYEQDLIQELKKLSCVSEIKCVFGVYDLVIKIRAGSDREVKEIISRIRLINNVKSTLTMMIIEG